MWGRLPEDLVQQIPDPAYVDVEGQAQEYRGTLQVKLDRLRVMGRDEVAEEDYLPATEQEKWRALVNAMRSDGTMLRIFEKYFSADLATTLVNF